MELRPYASNPNRAVITIEDQDELAVIDAALRHARNIRDVTKIVSLNVRADIFKAMGRAGQEYPIKTKFSIPQLDRMTSSLVTAPVQGLARTAEIITVQLTNYLTPDISGVVATSTTVIVGELEPAVRVLLYVAAFALMEYSGSRH